MNQPTQSQLLRVSEVQRIFDVSRRTVYAWHQRGHLRAVVLPTGVMRWRQADVDALIAQGVSR